jgi:molecular chaperone DnaK
LIDANTTIPTKKSEVFSTASDNQPSVEIHVLQGERAMAKDNRTIGKFHLDGLPPAPRGVPQVEVIFDIDANGIINVSALDKATNKLQSIRIEASSGLSKEDIEKAQKEAEAHADEDKKKKEAVEVRNQADTLIYTAEKTLADAGDKVKEDDKKTINESVAVLKEKKDSEDLEEIKKLTEDLNSKLMKVGEQMYKEEDGEEKKDDSKDESKDEDKKDDGAEEGEIVDDKKEEK